MGFFLLIFLFPFQGHTQLESSPTLAQRQAYADVMRLDFSTIQQQLNNPHQSQSQKGFNFHIKDYANFLKVFVGENEYDLEQGLKQRDSYISFWHDLPNSDAYKYFYIGDAYLRWALLRMKHGSYFKGAYDLKYAHKYLSRSLKKDEHFPPSVADMGVLNVLMGSIPDAYKWITTVFNMGGDVVKGKQQIEHALISIRNNRQYEFIDMPLFFVQSYIAISTLDTDEEENRADLLQALREQKEEGSLAHQPLMIFLLAKILQGEQKNEEALEVLELYRPEATEYPFYYLYYLKGLSQLFDMDSACLDNFNLFLNHFSGGSYIKSAHQRKAWYYLIHGDTAMYFTALSGAIKNGEKRMGSDKQAYRDACDKVIPNVDLLKSRLLFDGGHYSEALEALPLLEDVQDDNLLQVECLYRKGRIFHEQKDYERAVKSYQSCYEKGRTRKEYYAANAKLMEGRIYLRQHLYEKALGCFKTCLSMSGFQYEYTIHRKAKSGMAEVLYVMP